jgi:hypothetical protein
VAIRTETPTESLELRLRGSADAVDAWLDGYEDEVRVRDGIVLEAIDAGCNRGAVATWAHLSPTRVTQIVAKRAAEGSTSSSG